MRSRRIAQRQRGSFSGPSSAEEEWRLAALRSTVQAPAATHALAAQPSGHTFGRLLLFPGAVPATESAFAAVQRAGVSGPGRGADVDLGARIRAAADGLALPTDIQRRLETGLGADLSAVRIHTDGEADQLTRAVDAVAFTSGSDIFFRSGAYRPETAGGLHLLAHEAAHVAQQAAGPVAGTPAPGGVALSDPGDPFERAAEASAARIVQSIAREAGQERTSARSVGAAQRRTGFEGGVNVVQRRLAGAIGAPSGGPVAVQRTHPAFNEHNYWKSPLPAIPELGIPAMPAPGSPDDVMQRLLKKFNQEVADQLLFTDAAEEDAIPREHMTEQFIKDGGTLAAAAALLRTHPRDNAALGDAFNVFIPLKAKFNEQVATLLASARLAKDDLTSRERMVEGYIKGGGTLAAVVAPLRAHPEDNAAFSEALRASLTEQFHAEGGTKEKSAVLLGRHPTDIAALGGAFHRSLLGDQVGRYEKVEARVVELHFHQLELKDSTKPAGLMSIEDDIEALLKAAKGNVGAVSRAEHIRGIERLEAWAGPRHAVLTALDKAGVAAVESMVGLYSEVRPYVVALFHTEPFNPTKMEAALDGIKATVPFKRLSFKTPKQLEDECVSTVRALWGVDEATARSIALEFYRKREQTALETLRTNAVPKATYDTLRSLLTFEQTVEAIKVNGATAALNGLNWRLQHLTHNGANLTAITAANLVTIPVGRHFPYMGGHHGPQIETELTIDWNHGLWMPTGMRRWGVLHIHYYGTVADPTQISYPHIKVDAAIPGGVPINANHPVIVNAYATGKLDPTWHI